MEVNSVSKLQNLESSGHPNTALDNVVSSSSILGEQRSDLELSLSSECVGILGQRLSWPKTCMIGDLTECVTPPTASFAPEKVVNDSPLLNSPKQASAVGSPRPSPNQASAVGSPPPSPTVSIPGTTPTLEPEHVKQLGSPSSQLQRILLVERTVSNNSSPVKASPEKQVMAKPSVPVGVPPRLSLDPKDLSSAIEGRRARMDQEFAVERDREAFGPRLRPTTASPVPKVGLPVAVTAEAMKHLSKRNT